MASPGRFRLPGAPVDWNRRRLQILLLVGAIVAATVTVGCVWSIRSLMGSDPAPGPVGTVRLRGLSPQDRLAAEPLRVADLEEAQPGALSTGSADTIWVPQPRDVGAAQVGTGFRRSPQGALAQLVEIDQRALESASVVTAQHVIASWAVPGGPTEQTWSGVKAVVALLSSAALPGHGAGDAAVEDLQVALEPAMGLIKGTVGEDFVVVCVDFVATITPPSNSASTAAVRVAIADCQRMVWQLDRWLIGSGPEPASSPSIWPGTQASYDAGYQWLAVNP